LLVTGVLGTAVGQTLGAAPATAGAATAQVAAVGEGNVVTPGDFTGYGFDQCHAPDQRAMNKWLTYSPFLAVGIYISGNSRACRDQPNLTPEWISTQLAKGWRLLPITLGPQASCQPRFPRYGNDKRISSTPGSKNRYPTARRQARTTAVTAVGDAQALGIAPGSTLWYDLEGFDSTNTRCRESALAFLSAWTVKVHDLGYVSGVYSSAGSGIAMLDDARVQRPGKFALPDQIWVARWDGRADTETSYLRSDGWRPHARVKQYQGGHDETWGGVRINIDRNFLDVGRGSFAPKERHCDGVRVGYPDYPAVRPATRTTVPSARAVRALQCLLTEQGVYHRAINGHYNARTLRATNSWQRAHGDTVSQVWSRQNWMTLLAAGDRPVAKIGSAGPAVRRVQRALNAWSKGVTIRANGVFDRGTDAALRRWQRKVGVKVTGVAGSQSWSALAAGRR
jgi:peptidoglycan hydrolase-like protein with peptidoglycan-binding domain